MVKNTKGGSGHKSQARKFASTNNKTSNKATRFSQDEYEYYAQVVATLGNGMCHVMCKDGKKRLCHIRGKFRGRGMRDNMVKNGVWVLVGGRDFEAERTAEDKKLENCDLLEVYSDLDKERLKLLGGFSDFVTRDCAFTNTRADSDDFIEFSDNVIEDEYANLMEKVKNASISSSKLIISHSVQEDEINVDDI